MNPSYWLALGSCISFAFASLVFTHYARKVSVLWMNAFKSAVAMVAFAVALLLSRQIAHAPRLESLICFMVSGLVGLNIGDLFLVQAFKTIGPARTLVIFSFQPIFLAIFAFFLFGQTLTWMKAFGILFMMACVFTLSFEKFKADGKWDFRGPLCALMGVLLDSCGILLTRHAFDVDSQIGSLEGNFYRCLGANLGFLAMSFYRPIGLTRVFFKMSHRTRMTVFLGGLLGTFISLWMYLTAVSVGHLATISAIIGAGPVFAAVFESIFEKKWPTRYLYIAFALFACGFALVF